MQSEDFKRIVATFADQENEFVTSGGTLLMYIRGKLVQAKIKDDPQKGISVIHNEAEYSARSWIFSYLAKLDDLAQRIIDYIHPPENYVSPNVNLLDWQNKPEEKDSSIDSLILLRKRLTEFPAGMTSINFLTSDAGEGKTSLIEKISVEQAQDFKKNKTGSLILPVSLGGRSFLRFDDVVIGALMNRLRFPYLYYDSFIELIKMNAIIPAFDGFEEVLVDVSSAEAVTAVGHLADQLSSSGTLLFAARKAYFDKSVNSQAKLFESIEQDQDVQIQRFALDRWDREVFIQYATRRGVSNPGHFYKQVKKRLGSENHPMLTRAVLVRRLIDLANEGDDLDNFLDKLGQTQEDYFVEFIEVIVKREAHEKWINRSGTEQSLLLTLDQHHQLLSQIASEMWVNAVDALRFDLIELIIEFFASENDINSDVERQICRRIQDHSLLKEDKSQGPTRHDRIRFDHEDIQEFYLGQSLGRSLIKSDNSEARLILNAQTLSNPVILEASRYLKKHQNKITVDEVLFNIEELAQEKPRVSYTRDNCGLLMIRLVQYANDTHQIKETNFPPNSLQQRKVKGLTVNNSLFGSTGLDHVTLTKCQFNDCRFVELIFNDDSKPNFDGTTFYNCTFDSVSIWNGDDEEPQKIFNPDKIHAVLKDKDILVKGKISEDIGRDISEPTIMDMDMKTALKFIRMFNRSTTINESGIQKRLTKKSNHFMNQILPELKKAKLIGVTNKSNSNYRLLVSQSEIDRLVDKSGSIFERFIQEALTLESTKSPLSH